MSVLALWLSKALWGWSGLVLVLSIIAGFGLLVAGIVCFFSLGARVRR
jgi:hypothetical protein